MMDPRDESETKAGSKPAAAKKVSPRSSARNAAAPRSLPTPSVERLVPKLTCAAVIRAPEKWRGIVTKLEAASALPAAGARADAPDIDLNN